jgi:hypothetical protein
MIEPEKQQLSENKDMVHRIIDGYPEMPEDMEIKCAP